MAAYELRDRVVFVTGAARGIGWDVARRAHARGALVALTGLEPELLEQRASELGARAIAVEADVTDLEAMERAAQTTAERLGGIDVVLANAGIQAHGTVATIDPAGFERVIDVNLLGVFRTVRATLPHVTERRGYVLAVASLSAGLHAPLMAPYSASKAATEAFADALRVEVAHRGVAVGCAYFGFIDTDLVSRSFDHRSVEIARERMGGVFQQRAPLAVAGKAVVRGIERRARIVVAPRWVRPMLGLRTVLQPLSERMAVRRGIADAVRQAEREATDLSTPQPGSVTVDA